MMGQAAGLRKHALSLRPETFVVAVVDDVSQLDTSLSHLVEAHSAYGKVVRTWRGKLKEAKCAVVSRAHSRNELLAAGFSEAAVDRGAVTGRI